MTEQTEQQKKVVTRFAPSPTGFLHSGTYRTAVFSYLFAKKHGGEFILRIEDTDKERSKKEYEDNIMESLSWLNMSYDRFYRQSENAPRHKEILEKLISNGNAYISKEEARDGSGVIKEIVRFKNPNRIVSFVDAIRGEIKMDTTDLGDFVIAKNLNEPLFHLAVVVDDADEGVTHIIRGDDHISNTPRHILLYEALGFEVPTYAHLPLVLSEDRTKLSKRKGAKAITEYRDQGYLPGAMLNFITMIGFNDGTEKEIFTMDELIQAFDLEKVQKGGAIFNPVKLDWLNKEHIKLLSGADFKKQVLVYMSDALQSLPTFTERIDAVLPTIKERLTKFGDIRDMEAVGDLQYFFIDPSYDSALLLCTEKQRKGKESMIIADLVPVYGNLKTIISQINAADGNFTPDSIKEAVWPYAEQEGRGLVLWALRTALSGKERSPDPFTLVSIFGKEEAIRRIDIALQKIHESTQ
ncbi:MAG: glutamate--tRNA ligase [Candidatus Pacebacteria bacterium]|nr:glutamate--tRNA ligase [Candidatus Paceibacterota bacterium]